MNFGSVCSGIEAASVAWNPLGWRAQFVSEIDRFPCEVLEQRHAGVPNYGDMTRFKDWPDATIDVLVGGTPCQSFSVAGLRKGLDDPRGNLMLTYLAIAARYRPKWLVWENVPGVLSSGGGRDFGSLLGGLVELGYGFAYRVLDAQYFNLAQRRERVFVVGCLGDWRSAAAVLFERSSLRGDSAPSRQTGKSVAASLTSGSHPGSNAPGRRREDDINLVPFSVAGHAGYSESIGTLRANGGDLGGGQRNAPSAADVGTLTLAIRGRAGESTLECRDDGLANAILTPNGGRGGIGVGAIAFNARQDPDSWTERTGPLDTDGGTQAIAIHPHCIGRAPTAGAQGKEYLTDGSAYTMDGRGVAQAVAFAQNQRDKVRTMAIAGTLAKESGMKQQTYVSQAMAVRRLTPLECERLMGFPDNFTAITRANGKLAADGPRYKALGNSMAVPCMAWIGRRIAAVASTFQSAGNQADTAPVFDPDAGSEAPTPRGSLPNSLGTSTSEAKL